eukprot:GHUV01019787.1.p1 GENE.GHUV01019787.1~~GHUV01019787.1.p1  ORF type:complete len:145 (+),score=8.99 GHUV01019787.1:413-847(+)
MCCLVPERRHPSTKSVRHSTISVVPTLLFAGQEMDLKVVSVDVPRCRVALSLRQMQKDPLQTTMDSIQWKDTVQAPAEVEQIIQVLELTAGINSVKLGRQAEEPHTVAQVSSIPASCGILQSFSNSHSRRAGILAGCIRCLTGT